MKLLSMLIGVLIPAVGILIGLFIFLKPALAIELQKKFYEKLNWRIEPVSMEKELRHTKIMGLFLIVISLLISIYVLILIKAVYLNS